MPVKKSAINLYSFPVNRLNTKTRPRPGIGYCLSCSTKTLAPKHLLEDLVLDVGGEVFEGRSWASRGTRISRGTGTSRETHFVSVCCTTETIWRMADFREVVDCRRGGSEYREPFPLYVPRTNSRAFSIQHSFRIRRLSSLRLRFYPGRVCRRSLLCLHSHFGYI